MAQTDKVQLNKCSFRTRSRSIGDFFSYQEVVLHIFHSAFVFFSFLVSHFLPHLFPFDHFFSFLAFSASLHNPSLCMSNLPISNIFAPNRPSDHKHKSKTEEKEEGKEETCLQEGASYHLHACITID